jgi:DNA-binding MarR family transcriptional regulator
LAAVASATIRWYQRNVSLSNTHLLPADQVAHVARTCRCFHAQRAARRLARLFDQAFRPLGLTNTQFSLLMALNQPAPTISRLAALLAMDRTSLTAALKPLERGGLVEVAADPDDRRARAVMITPAGVARLKRALPIWQETHHRLDQADAAANQEGAT